MRRRHLRFSAVVTLLWAAAHPMVLAGQAVATDAYVGVVAGHFGVSEGEMTILAQEVGLQELPVLLRISVRSGISTAALLAQRRSGVGWMDIAGRYDLGPSHFRVSIAPDQAGPLLERAQRAFAEGDPDNIELGDEEIVALENVRLFADALGVSIEEVVRVRAESSSFVEVAGALTGPQR